MNANLRFKSIKFGLVPGYFNFLIILALLLPSFASWSQNRARDSIQALARLDSLETKANHYSEDHPSEKVYVHFDKPFYALGEDSWYKAYVVVTSNLEPTDISSVLYLDWIDPSGKVITHRRMKIENGGAAGDFSFDKTFPEGTYTVRAYTNWMRNEDPELFYSKKIRVFNTGTPRSERQDSVSSKIDLQFFPEGGTLVADTKTQIAFKAIDGNGRSVEVEGRILDENDRFITTFRSAQNGMGLFPFIPQGHKSYHAVLQKGESYPLPHPAEKGLVLTASNMHAGKILVRVQASKEHQSGAYLIGHSRGSICYGAYIKLDGPIKDFSISKEELPEGILQLTVFDSEGIPQCERMFFIKKDHKMVVAIKSDKEKYSPRDSVILNIKVNDMKGDPVETSLSVSVTDAGFVSADRNSENIYTRLLLQSDLKGNVENPGWYFESQTAERIYALDLVMLTHGWSRYNWKEILNPAVKPVRFKPEKGISLRGEILAHNKPAPNAPILLTIPQPGDTLINIYESDSLGHFDIADLNFSDSTLISWRIMKTKGSFLNPKIKLNTTSDVPPVILNDGPYEIADGSKKELSEKLRTQFNKTGVWSLDNFKMLDEVVVKAQRVKAVSVSRNAIMVSPDAADLKSRIATSQFVGRYALKLPMVKPRETPDGIVWGMESGYIGGRIKWVGVTISINGTVIEATGMAANPYVILNSVPVEQIEHVLVAGNAHEGYFIEVKTKNTSFQSDLGVIQQKIKGYDAAREFYHPRYGPLDPSTGPDHRMTLYWRADLRTGNDGTATAKFYNTDSTQKFLITVEGIASGLPLSTVKIIGKED